MPMANRYVPITVENWRMLSPSRYDASAPATSSYTSPHAAISRTVRKTAICKGASAGEEGGTAKTGDVGRWIDAGDDGAEPATSSPRTNSRLGTARSPPARTGLAVRVETSSARTIAVLSRGLHAPGRRTQPSARAAT